jgi:hypothetical protein
MFTPAPQDAGSAKLDAARAFAGYYRGADIPSYNDAVYGVFNWNFGGDDGYRYKDLAVWGFGMYVTCPAPPVANARPLPKSDKCIDWTFINANTGAQVIGPTQVIASRG